MNENIKETNEKLVKMLVTAQTTFNSLIEQIQEVQNKYFSVCQYFILKKDNIQDDQLFQEDYLEDSIQDYKPKKRSSTYKKGNNNDGSIKKKKGFQKLYVRQRSRTKFEKSIIKTHQKFGNKLKKIICMNEICDDNSDQSLNCMMEPNQELPIIDEMVKVIEGANPINPNHILYLIGIDVSNPYLEELFKNEFYESALKSVNSQLQKCSKIVEKAGVDASDDNCSNKLETNILQHIILQFYYKKRLELVNSTAALLKVSARIWLVQKQSRAIILASNYVQNEVADTASCHNFNQVEPTRDSCEKPIKNESSPVSQNQNKLINAVEIKQNVVIPRGLLKEMRLQYPKAIQGNKNYSCLYCEKQYKSYIGFVEHIRCYHPLESIQQLNQFDKTDDIEQI